MSENEQVKLLGIPEINNMRMDGARQKDGYLFTFSNAGIGLCIAYQKIFINYHRLYFLVMLFFSLSLVGVVLSFIFSDIALSGKARFLGMQYLPGASITDKEKQVDEKNYNRMSAWADVCNWAAFISFLAAIVCLVLFSYLSIGIF